MLLLVCGWPACGKSTFGDWLEAHHGFRHFDVNEPKFEDEDIRSHWNDLLPHSSSEFVARLLQEGPDWVITWGAGKDCMPHLEALRSAGFDPWFFLPGNEQRSRLEWLQRERQKDPNVRASVWERQAGEIRKGARDLRRYFRGHCIESISSNGECVACEVLAENMSLQLVGS